MDAILFWKVCFCKIEFGSNPKLKTYLRPLHIFFIMWLHELLCSCLLNRIGIFCVECTLETLVSHYHNPPMRFLYYWMYKNIYVIYSFPISIPTKCIGLLFRRKLVHKRDRCAMITNFSPCDISIHKLDASWVLSALTIVLMNSIHNMCSIYFGSCKLGC